MDSGRRGVYGVLFLYLRCVFCSYNFVHTWFSVFKERSIGSSLLRWFVVELMVSIYLTK